MIDRENEKLDFTTSTKDSEKNEFSFMVPAGTEASFSDGYQAEKDDFSFVQQDKSIHDIKFNTKPTTFFRDAMRRFAKNRSSVAGGIILGILFLLAIILPIDGVVNFDIVDTHTEEVNLPPKLFEAGTGFWDGTFVSEDQPSPYDEEGNIRSDYPNASSIISVGEITTAYQDNYVSDGKGGYVTAIRDASLGTGRLYSYAYEYDFSGGNVYTFSFTLGTSDESTYATPSYYPIFVSNNQVFPLAEATSDYGPVAKEPGEGASIALHSTQTYNLNELVAQNEELSKLVTSSNTLTGSLGLGFSGTSGMVALYLHDFTISSSSTNILETAQLQMRSFDDANAVINEPVTVNNVDNVAYWAIISDTSYPSDVEVQRCDIRFDAYQIAYGSKSNVTVPQQTIDSWVEQGLVEIDYAQGNASGNPSYRKTEAGESSTLVYVDSIDSQTPTSSTGYNLVCTVTVWKQLNYLYGTDYDSIPSHLLGTDSRGRDMLKYVFAGLRTSLILGVIVSAINIFIGIVWGSISGYFGGKVDLIMERIVDILAGIPWIVLMTVLCIKMGQTTFVFGLALCLTGWIGTEAITRSQFYRYRGREYVMASRTLGARSPRLIFRHILPNAIGTIVTSSVLMIPSVIFNEATISFLGLGLQGTASLGVILSDNQEAIQNATLAYQLIIPAVIISLLMICFNLFGNGLRDAFNPSLKGQD